MSPRALREFIYLDEPRLYSLYAQAFGGLTGQVQSAAVKHLASDVSADAGGEKSGIAVAETDVQTKSTVLYDHMYSELAAKLEPVTFCVDGLSAEEARSALPGRFFIKVTGTPEIQDFARIQKLAANVERIGDSIAYAHCAAMEGFQALARVPSQIKALEATAKTLHGPDLAAQKREIATLRQLPTMEDVVAATRANLGLEIDPGLCRVITDWIDLFAPEAFEIDIVPGARPDIAYCGYIDRAHLRLSSDYLCRLYGPMADRPWTMVGQVTCVPTEPANLASGPPAATASTDASGNLGGGITDNGSMRDPIRQLFGATSFFERMFHGSRTRTEILVRPLAIYEEVDLPA